MTVELQHVHGHYCQRVIAFCVDGKYNMRMYCIRPEHVDSLVMYSYELSNGFLLQDIKCLSVLKWTGGVSGSRKGTQILLPCPWINNKADSDRPHTVPHLPSCQVLIFRHPHCPTPAQSCFSHHLPVTAPSHRTPSAFYTTDLPIILPFKCISEVSLHSCYYLKK